MASSNWRELNYGDAAKTTVIVNLDNVAYVQPHSSGTTIFFAAGKGESGLNGITVAQTPDEIFQGPPFYVA